MNSEAPFRLALEAHRSGCLKEAESGCRRVLKLDPRHADALYWLGLIYAGRGILPEAAVLIQQAIGTMRTVDFFASLGNVPRQHGLVWDAEAACRRAIELKHD